MPLTRWRTTPAAHACGEQATGYRVGPSPAAREKPHLNHVHEVRPEVPPEIQRIGLEGKFSMDTV
jgi:hypothetical protein